MKIISGGQTGADRAALDAALALGLDYGGAIPKGRKAEDGPLDAKYQSLEELKSESYKVRTEKNVLDADATIIFTVGSPGGGTSLTVQLAQKYNKDFFIIDLSEESEPWAIRLIEEWLDRVNPQVLNVAGPRESEKPGIYIRVYTILMKVLSASL